MANEFIARNGIIALSNTVITGSLTVTGGITGSLSGSATNAISASYATTASYVIGGGGGGVTQITAGTNVTISPTNGLGNVTINASGGGGSSQWTTSGNSIYYNTGNVSIGSSSSVSRLYVTDSPLTSTSNILTVYNSSTGSHDSATLALGTAKANGIADIRLANTNTTGLRMYAHNDQLSAQPAGAGFQFFNNSDPSFGGQVYFDAGSTDTGGIIFRTGLTNNPITEQMRIDPYGTILLHDYDVVLYSSINGYGGYFGANNSSGLQFNGNTTIVGDWNGIGNGTTLKVDSSARSYIFSDGNSGYPSFQIGDGIGAGYHWYLYTWDNDALSLRKGVTEYGAIYTQNGNTYDIVNGLIVEGGQ